MKKNISLNNILIFGGAIYLAITVLPRSMNNMNQEGKSIDAQEYEVIEITETGKKLVFPPEHRTIAIFWATCPSSPNWITAFGKNIAPARIITTLTR